MATQATDINDINKSTLPHLPKLEFKSIAQRLRGYPVMSQWLKKDRVMFSGGHSIKEVLWHKTLSAAKVVDLVEPDDDISFGDILKDLTIPWTQRQTYWWMHRRDVLYNTGKAMIIKVVEPRRLAAMLDMADLLEQEAWTLSSQSNTKNMFSVPFWLPWSATRGFNGAMPTGYTGTTKAGVDTAVVTTFRNYTFPFTDVTRTDLIREMKRAMQRTKWKPPIDFGNGSAGESDYTIYTTGEGEILMTERAEDQNNNLGADVDSMNGRLRVKRIPIVEVPQLGDQDPTNTKMPFYGIDHSTFYMGVLTGDYLYETVRPAPKQHNYSVTWVDLSCNTVCCNPRQNWVGAKLDPAT